MKINRMLEKMGLIREQGAAMLLAIVAILIMATIGGSFALLVQNEAASHARGTAYEQALYVAEAGVEEVLYQRSKNQSSLCFPYTDDGTLSGAAGAMATGNPATCIDDPNDPRYVEGYDADTADGDNDIVPCWPYNEKFYANRLVFGPNFYCNDGSDSSKCPTYRPLGVWPSNAGGVGWKDMNPNKPVPLSNAGSSSGQRFTTGLFTVCNDNFVGDDTSVEPAASQVCATPPCARRVVMLSIVSVGEVQARPGETVQRAVKVDIIPPALYSGVIDKYVDLTLMYQTAIHGPIHINGWWNPNASAYAAFLLFSSASLAPIFTIFDPPDLVSVSYPEDPTNPDWQPPLGLAHITYVHLPMRIDIPNMNWDQFEDRMKDLYADALDLYGAGQVHRLRRDDYNASNMYDPYGDGSNEFECYPTNGLGQPSYSLGDAGKTVGLISGNVEFSNCRESDGLLEMVCPGPWNNPQCCSPNARTGRIHNCNRDNPEVWSNVAFDLYDVNTGGPVTGSEPAHIGGGSGPRDRSLRYITKTVYSVHLGDIISGGGGCSITNPFGCLTEDINRPEFVFMGKHEYQGKVFIDGTMGVGLRTPYHTCGEGDGTLTFFCIVIPPIDLGFATIPSWHFGVPHWHTGKATVKGEMLINGKMFMADYIYIDGGALYADDSIIKDESSGIDIMLNVSELLKSIIKLIFPALAAPPISWIFDLAWGFIDIILQGLFPWWPTIDLTNNALLDWECYLDINGWNAANVINSGTIYTRGNFEYKVPGFDSTTSILNMLVGQFIPIGGFTFQPAMDPVRIWNYGAIVAGGHPLNWNWANPDLYVGGNIYLDNHKRLDIVVGDPSNNSNEIPTNTGYVFARNNVQVWSDIISHYSGAGLFDNCNSWLGVDEDCAAQGIFYSGGFAEPKADPMASFSTAGCVNPEEPDFWTGDPLGNIQCWLPGIPVVCSLLSSIPLIGGGCYNPSEKDIKGYIFAGQVGAMPMTYFRLDQNSSVLHKAVERRYYKTLTSSPVDWMEIEPPANIPHLTP